ncbi:malectin-B-like isoform X2 [Glandiceps talaboti]
MLHITRVSPQDQPLYQTERYDLDTFGYEVPIEEDGDYVLVLKFCEVYFTASNQKVFDVVLNEQHTVVPELDIYDKVGRGTAHDEIVPFTITRGKLKVQGEVSTFSGTLLVEFIKGYRDNPKVNALYVLKGSTDDVPKLPPIPGLDLDEEEEEEEDTEREQRREMKKKRTSGPKTVDPYASDDSSLMFPILISVGIFIPTLFCLCRL